MSHVRGLARPVPDFAKLHALEEQRAARWKRQHKKELTVPKGFRLNPAPPNSQKHAGKNDTDNEWLSDREREKERAERLATATLTHGDQHQQHGVDRVAMRPISAVGQASIPWSAGSSNSKFVNKVKDATSASMDEDRMAPRVGAPSQQILYPYAFKGSKSRGPDEAPKRTLSGFEYGPGISVPGGSRGGISAPGLPPHAMPPQQAKREDQNRLSAQSYDVGSGGEGAREALQARQPAAQHPRPTTAGRLRDEEGDVSKMLVRESALLEAKALGGSGTMAGGLGGRGVGESSSKGGNTVLAYTAARTAWRQADAAPDGSGSADACTSAESSSVNAVGGGGHAVGGGSKRTGSKADESYRATMTSTTSITSLTSTTSVTRPSSAANKVLPDKLLPDRRPSTSSASRRRFQGVVESHHLQPKAHLPPPPHCILIADAAALPSATATVALSRAAPPPGGMEHEEHQAKASGEGRGEGDKAVEEPRDVRDLNAAAAEAPTKHKKQLPAAEHAAVGAHKHPGAGDGRAGGEQGGGGGEGEDGLRSAGRMHLLGPIVKAADVQARSGKEVDIHKLKQLVLSINSSHLKKLDQPFSSHPFYVMGKTLGEGAYGKVRLAVHRMTGEKVAVKTFEKSKLTEPQAHKRVAREVRILKALRHPNIIRLLEVVEEPYRRLIMMEYSSGGDLCRYVRDNRRLNEAEAARLFVQIVDGLTYCHACGIVHRDVKLDNLLLDDNRNIRIVDFGFSVSYQRGQKLRKACGSPSYAAPEIVARRPYCPAGVDVWSLGVVLYAMVCGYFPFQGNNNQELCRKIVKGRFECPSFMSSECRDLVRLMLNVDPSKRISIDKCGRHVWARSANDKRPSVGPEDAPVHAVDCEASMDSVNGLCGTEPDPDIVDKCAALGFMHDYTHQCVRNNRHNLCNTTYCLLLQKRQREHARRQPTVATD